MSETPDTTSVTQLLDSLGLEAGVDEGDLISGALLIFTIVDSDGDERLSVRKSDGLSWITASGMLAIAQHNDLCID